MDGIGRHHAPALLDATPMTFRTRLVVLLVSTPLVAFAVVGGLLGKTVTREDTYQHLRVFEDVVNLILGNYVEVVDVDRVMEGALRGLAESLDPDSSYLPPDLVPAVEQRTPLEPGETGLELTRQYYLRVVSARDGSPAARAGLRTGDYIRAIDGASTRTMSIIEGQRRLRGPVGSKVTLTVLRGSAAEPHPVEIVREAVRLEPVRIRMAAPGVGLLRISTFDGEVVDAIRNGVAALQAQAAARLVIDLRGTAQGPLDAGIAAARLFVASGTLVQRQARGGQPEPIATGRGDGPITIPVVLLVTSGTSGAAELFAAALAGNGRAELVGERTLGRAGVQKLVRFADGSGLWLTWARYLTPSGKAIHGSGLEPTVEVEDPDVEFGTEPPADDPILEKALERWNVKKAA
jgi:carboxyl-terminal processing protease